MLVGGLEIVGICVPSDNSQELYNIADQCNAEVMNLMGGLILWTGEFKFKSNNSKISKLEVVPVNSNQFLEYFSLIKVEIEID